MKKAVGIGIAIVIAVIVFAAAVYAVNTINESPELETNDNSDAAGKTIKLNLSESVGLGDAP